MVLALVVALVSQGKTVTFTHPCAHSSVVLEAFGEAIGETIKIGGSVDKDYFLVRFDDMPVEDAKAAIARTLNAKWERKGETLYLTRTSAQENAERNKVSKQFEKELKGDIAAAQNRNRKRRPYSMEYLVESMQKETGRSMFGGFTHNESPLRRFDDRIMASLNADDLIAMPEGTVYFSTEPKADEQPFPQSWLSAVQAYRDENEMWSQALDRLFDEDDDRRGWSFGTDSVVDSASITVERERDSVSLGLHMSYGSGGLSSGIGGTRGGYGGESEWHRFTSDLDKPFEVPEGLEGVWKERVMWGYASGYALVAARKRMEVPEILQKIFADTANNEPLNTLVSWPIMQAARYKDTNVVVLLADGTLGWTYESHLTQGGSLSSLFSYYGPRLWAEYDKELECWLARPFDPARVRDERMDRTAFGALLKKADAQKWVRLDDMSHYFQRSGGTGFARGWGNLVDEALTIDPTIRAYSTMDSRERFATQLYSLIPRTQQKAARSGGVTIAIAGWSRALRQALASAPWADPRFLPEGEVLEEYDSPQGRLASAVFRGRLPAGTFMRVEVTSKNGLWVSTDGKTGHEQELENYAFRAYQGEPEFRAKPEKDKFAVGLSETLVVDIFVPGAGTLRLTDRYGRSPFIDEFVPLEKLPGAFKASLKAALKKARGGGR